MISAYDLAASLLPPVRRLRSQRDRLAGELDQARIELDSCHAEARRLAAELADIEPWVRTPRLYPPGHFYSPEPNLDEVRRRAEMIFRTPDNVTGVDLRLDTQLSLLRQLAVSWPDWPYDSAPRADVRFSPENDYFGHVDSLVLFGLLQMLTPKRYVEVGSGWSSALVLDVRDRYLTELEATFIEPYPERLYSLLSPEEATQARVIERPVQEVDSATFEELDPGDILFIDSTHVSKVGSDVNHLLFDVLPRVAPGVWIHIHDIPYPFEYSTGWVFEGRSWNEAYLLHALLMDSPAWRIELWASCLQVLRKDQLLRLLPPETPLDGASLWMRRT